MNQFIIAIRNSLENGNWYAALFSTLALPDICGKIQYPDQYSSTRYPNWFNEYVLEKYTSYVGADRKKTEFLNGNDCYALRCAFLHEGITDITKQKAREALENYKFIMPHPGIILHNNLLDNTLQLQIDIFCEDICQGVEAWLEDISDDEIIQSRIEENLRILSIHEV